MKKLVILIRQNDLGKVSDVDFFRIEETTEKPKENFKEAIKSYLLTAEGKETVQNNCGYFNWFDAITEVPNEIWNNYGIEPIQLGDNLVFNTPIKITVEEDENLTY